MHKALAIGSFHKEMLCNVCMLKTKGGGFPGGPVAKAVCSQCRDPGRSLIRALDPTLSLHAVAEDPTCHH